MALRFAPARGASVVISSSSRGPTGAAATITAGVGTSLAEGATPTVSNSGTSSAAIFNFGIPRGVITALGWNFDTSTTDADPGAGDVRFNHATPASVTSIYIDNVDRDGTTQTTWLDSLDDGGTSSHRGVLTIIPAATPTAKLVYDVTGSVVDGTGYRKLTVAHVSGTTLPSDTAHLAFVFARDGAQGIIGGSTGASDNRLLRSDGTGGGTLQNTGITVDDTDNVTGVASIGIGNAGLKVFDTNASHYLIFVPGSDLTADRNLTITTGDAARTVTLSGNPTLDDWFDQSVKVAASPTFAAVQVGNTGLKVADTNASHYLVIVPGSDLTANRNLTITTGDAARTITLSGDLTVGATSSISGTAAVLAGNQTLTGGFKGTAFAAGTKSSGTFTPDPLNSNLQTATNGGAHTLAPPGVDCTMTIQYTNNGSAGAITTSGFTKVDGSFTTTNGDDFFANIEQIGSFSYLSIVRLQ